ncbi:MBL fold metallo-hydrolase [Candidatus Micrarchaeota archaeon]|nr:MBL fold metallo-hydrolase [Candidatus Micrarchaeota archaeon]
MKSIIILLACSILLFGCIIGGGENNQTNQTPSDNNTVQNQTPAKNTTVTVIINPQKNQTIEQNVTVNESQPPVQPPSKNITYDYEPSKPMVVYFIDIGEPAHGNAILIKKGDLDVLVDGGPGVNAGKVVDFLRSRGVDDIDLMISSNPDPRNYGGLDSVADQYKVENFWWNGEQLNDNNYATLVNKMKGITKDTKIVGEEDLIELNGITFEVLNPSKTTPTNDVNNDGIVLRVSEGNFSMLLTSGIQTGTQGRLLSAVPEKVTADVMLAPYYGVGAGTSNMARWLSKAAPKTMIITGSADESPPNGGSRDPFKRLMKEYKVAWYETYINGTIRVTTDGTSYGVYSFGKGQ